VIAAPHRGSQANQKPKKKPNTHPTRIGVHLPDLEAKNPKSRATVRRAAQTRPFGQCHHPPIF
jgi:hypothetical protein